MLVGVHDLVEVGELAFEHPVTLDVSVTAVLYTVELHTKEEEEEGGGLN